MKHSKKIAFLVTTLLISVRLARADIGGTGNTAISDSGMGYTTDTTTFDDGSTISITTDDAGRTVSVTSTESKDGSSGSGGKIICTELYKQGYLSEAIFNADKAFGLELVKNNHTIYLGYIVWAPFIVRLMKRSALFTEIVGFFAIPWARQMAYSRNVIPEGSLFGMALMSFGLFFCSVVGNMKLLYKREAQRALSF